jgi:serine protease Do
MSALALAFGVSFACLARENNPPVTLKVDAKSINRDAHPGISYATVIKKASPSVVNIYSTKTRQLPRNHPYFDDPLFERYFGDGGTPGRRGPRSLKEESLGSGVIVTEDGYILTDNHVVAGADPDGVKVALGDGKQKLNARVVGTDPQTDLAVLKVEGKGLPAITIADSDKLEVGDVVLAIGNPFNVGQSVTLGIVSALGRGGFDITDYEDFIQTDAAINPGNSGGALVDTEGRLIGINQSILSRSGGNAGVGFAVPVNLAVSVMNQLVQAGKVSRGYLGVMIQPVSPDLAKAFSLPDTAGALVGGVAPNTPAAAAGVKEGDVITAVNGKTGADSRHIRLLISQNLPGSKVALTILRDGKQRTLNVTLAQMPGEETVASGAGPAEQQSHDALDGVEVADLTGESRKQFEVPNQIRGALVASVDAESNAYEAGLRVGVVIQEIDRQPVGSADEAVALSGKANGDRLLLRIWSHEGDMSGSRFVTVDNKRRK